jgi:hypothetical protein
MWMYDSGPTLMPSLSVAETPVRKRVADLRRRDRQHPRADVGAHVEAGVEVVAALAVVAAAHFAHQPTTSCGMSCGPTGQGIGPLRFAAAVPARRLAPPPPLRRRQAQHAQRQRIGHDQLPSRSTPCRAAHTGAPCRRRRSSTGGRSASSRAWSSPLGELHDAPARRRRCTGSRHA